MSRLRIQTKRPTGLDALQTDFKSERVVVIAPIGQDAAAIAALFSTVGIETTIPKDLTECSTEIEDADALLMTEEGLELAGLSNLLEVLRKQPAWSELPVIILTSGGKSRLTKLLDMAGDAAGSLMVLERPIATTTLLRALQVALLSRKRQYQVRELVEEQRRNAEREQMLRRSAEEAIRLQDEFLATMSHELRNPLNVIVGYSDLLARSHEIESLPQLLRMSLAIRRSALAQSHLIQDLLELSRLRSGKLTLNLETVSMIGAIHNALETVRREADGKRIVITIRALEEPLFVEGDPLRLEQIIWNVLTNAVKFTPPGGNVSISLNRQGSDVILTIEDSGQGIDPNFLPHVFEMFRQGDANTNRHHSGMGIGLALVRQLVQLHHGSVEVESEGLNKGTRVTIRIPEKTDWNLTIVRPSQSDTTALQQLIVLVVDDDEDTTDMLRYHLRDVGAIVFTATSGEEALRAAQERDIDVVLSDISMPGMDGFQLLNQLRALPGAKHVPAVAMTGLGQPEDEKHTKDAGFTAHLTKPIEFSAVVNVLQQAVKKQPRRN